MVFYESAKCLHGRMKTLKGRYYGSLFLHYQPVDESIWNYTTDVSTELMDVRVFEFIYVCYKLLKNLEKLKRSKMRFLCWYFILFYFVL